MKKPIKMTDRAEIRDMVHTTVREVERKSVLKKTIRRKAVLCSEKNKTALNFALYV